MKVYERIRRNMKANEGRWSQMRTNERQERQIKELKADEGK